MMKNQFFYKDNKKFIVDWTLIKFVAKVAWPLVWNRKEEKITKEKTTAITHKTLDIL